jgi:hypothetical protein
MNSKFKEILFGAVVTATLAIQAWTLTEVVNLKVQVARLEIRFDGFTVAKH